MTPAWPFLIAAALGAYGRGNEARQARTLGDAATTYWEGVRWTDPGKATPFVADLNARVALTQMLEDPAARLTGTTVIQAELGAEPKDGSPRPALILVRLEIIDVAKNRYETLSYAQHWQEVGPEWVVDTKLSPLGADRPWVIELTPAASP